MAKIEMAFSLEINDFVDAIEANELWMEGVLEDKKAFICVGKNCSAEGCFETLLNNRLLLKGITFMKMYDTSRQEPFCIKIT